jgi:hypothetical protein
MKHPLAIACMYLTLACDPDEAPAETADPSPGDGAEAPCTTTIVLGRYHDANCTPGAEFGTITLELADACGAWTRQSPQGTRDDSFTNYQCWSDRFCFTVHPGSATCETGDEDADIQLMAGACQPDKNQPGGVTNYTRILDGLDPCPAPPEGYACPDSAVGDATPGVSACVP